MYFLNFSIFNKISYYYHYWLQIYKKRWCDMTFITLNFENNSFFLNFAATSYQWLILDILTKSYHIQRRWSWASETSSCEWLTKSYIYKENRKWNRQDCCEWLTKSYHIQPTASTLGLTRSCELLTKSYHIQQVTIKSLSIKSISDNSQKKSCIMIDEIPLKRRDFMFNLIMISMLFMDYIS